MDDKWEDYTEYCDELRQQNADLVAVLKEMKLLLDDIYAEDVISSGDLSQAYERVEKALARVKGE